jgi:two-component system, NtrC family, sensor kinase
MAQLSLLDDNGAMARKWELGDNPVAVGRGDTADVCVQDQSLSRRHFLITRAGDKYLLEDLNSQNGTWVDGRRAAGMATTLKHHDCIAAGQTLFLFSEAQPAPQTYTQR